MEPEVSDPWLSGVVLVLAIFSIAIWFAFFERRRRGPLLAYEPRRPVPWSGIWILLPLLLVGATIYNAFQGVVPEVDDRSAAEMVERLSLGAGQEVAFVVAFLAI